MPRVLLVSGTQPVTLHLTTYPVTLVPGVPLEVPEGYRATLTRQDLTAPHLIVDAPHDPVEGSGLVLEPSAPPSPPKRRVRQPKEA